MVVVGGVRLAFRLVDSKEIPVNLFLPLQYIYKVSYLLITQSLAGDNSFSQVQLVSVRQRQHGQRWESRVPAPCFCSYG